MRSALLERIKGEPRGLSADRGWGALGAYGERYAPESRKDFVDAYRNRVWTHRCVDLIATSATQVRMQVKPTRGADPLEEHPLIDLLQRPCPRDPSLMFLEWSIRWAEVIGEWYWEVVPSVLGGIAELFPLRGHLVTVQPNEETGAVQGYRYDPAETGVEVVEYAAPVPGEATLQGEDDRPICLAGRYASPTDDYYGMSPLRAAKDDVISEFYAVRYDHRFFRNSARPDLIIGFKGNLDTDQRKLNREAFEDFKGVDKAHKAAVFSGDPDVHLLTQSQRDVEYLEGRRLSREGQCAAFGVPPVLIGDLTRATYSNYAQSEQIFWKSTMLPKLAYFASWVNAVLVPYFEDVEEFVFDVSEITALQEAEGWRSERVREEVAGGVLTPNEGRELLDREEVEEEGADSLWMPTRARPIDAEGSPEPGEVQPPGAGDPTPPAAVPPPAEGDPQADPPADPPPPPKGAAANLLRHKMSVASWHRQAREAKARFAHRATHELQNHFRDQRSAVLGLIEGREKASALEQALLAYGWDKDDAQLHAIVDAMQAGLATKAIGLTAKATDTDAGDGLLETTLREVGNRADGIQSVSGRVKDEVIEQVREGIANGLTYRQIAEGGTFESGETKVTIKGVQGVYDEYTTWQAERIARSEAGYTFNYASAGLMNEAGVAEVDVIDGDDDEECAEWNGSRRSLAEYEAEPLGHPNCTRVGLPVIE